MEIQIEQAGRVVEHITVDLAHGHDQLQGMADGVLHGYAVGDEEGEGAPGKLVPLSVQCPDIIRRRSEGEGDSVQQ